MHYFTKTFLTLITFLSIVFTFTFSIDPYNKLGINPWSLNFKGVFDYRTNKFHYLEQYSYKYQAYILGSSRAMQLQPNILIEKLNLKTYSYTVFTAMPEDYLAMTRQLVKFRPKLIWIQLDFYGFNSSFPPPKSFFNSPLSKLTNQNSSKNHFNIPVEYFSIHAFKDAIKVLKKNLKNEVPEKSPITGEGLRTNSNSKEVPLLKEYWNHEYENFHLSQQRFDDIKTIKKLCHENNITLLTSLSPMHIKHYQKVRQNHQLYKEYETFKEKIKEIFPNTIDYNTVQVRALTSGEYWMDSVHMSTKLGRLITYDFISKTHTLGKSLTIPNSTTNGREERVIQP